ncbi:ankyrin repeat domain-containing protein [Wolbachia endosymbiont of Oedothorax gibbosus]|uniref:ankyrin repeat domain-containing protein n=1 Tax=Wolbachia endosymbiont of Oedothorax gibbosus TaxID=931100 RepID=UPI00202506E9|nr:ankyrin repeat domain-containing protein [Wolbachia endosymbiont of Oedothorax gibbosus]
MSKELFLAVKNNDIGRVSALIAGGANVNIADEYGYTPLHVAVMHGHIDVVNILMASKANVDAMDKTYKYTPLYWAARNGYIEIVKVLIAGKASVNTANKYGYTPLHEAAQNGYIEIVGILILGKADVNTADEYGYTPLHGATQYGHIDVVNALIAGKANVNVVDEKELTPLHLAVQNGCVKIVKALLEEKADPLLGKRDFETLKYLVELIKNDSSKKVGVTQQNKEHMNDKYELLKYSFLFRRDCSFIDVVGKDILGNLMHKWFADASNLPPVQKKLSGELLSIFGGFLCCHNENYNDHITRLENFLRESKSNEDLKNILDLKRGESKLTVLHVLSSINDPLVEEFIKLLLEAGASHDMEDDRKRTPLDIAIGNHNYSVEKYFLTDKQKSLIKELRSALCNPTELEEFLNKHKDNKNLKRILNLHDYEGKSLFFEPIRDTLCSNGTSFKEAENLLLKAGAIDHEELDGKEYLLKSGTLWDNLILNQREKLKWFFHEVGKVQNMKKLEQVVNEAIKSGVRFNFPHQGSIYNNAYESKYSFTDYVIKKISDLKKSSQIASDIEVASGIVCKLVSEGALLYNISSMCVIDELEKFEGHKTNMKEAYAKYVNNTLEFMEIVKSAATGRVKNAKMDNSTFYLEYSEESTIDVAKITDGARDLGLTQGEIKYGRDIIKIGKSEVEIITANGIRDYTDLADGSDIVLTFYTSLGELEVNLYPDKKDKDKIIVEVSNKEEILEKFKNCKEELGKNCSFGGYRVCDAIEQGYFERSGKLMRSEAMSQSNGQTKKSSWVVREEIRRAPSFEETVSRCT